MFSLKKLLQIPPANSVSIIVILCVFSSLTFSQNAEIIIKFKMPETLSLGKVNVQDSLFLPYLRKNIGDVFIRPLLPQKSYLNRLNKSILSPFSFVYVLEKANGKFSQALIDSLNSLPVLEYACFNKTLTVHQMNTDPKLSKQWGLSRIYIQDAWKQTKGSRLGPIVVIDTGIEMSHEDLKNQIWINPGEDLNKNGMVDSSDSNNQDDDGNGFIDDICGWDFTDAPRYPDSGDYLEPDNNPADEHGHGTSVAGIIAAETGNDIGVAGVAPDCKIVNLRAFTSQGVGEEDDVAAAILYAVQMNFRIINMSFGDVFITPLLRDVIHYAYQNGVVMIASAGNSGNDKIHYPSGLAETISVGATTESDLRASFSSFGSALDLVAPGNAIFTTTIGNIYTEFGGTSASAPFVSGVAGLILTLYPEMSVEVLRNRLQQSCDDLGEIGWDFEFGAGLLRADHALADFGNATVKIIFPIQDQGFSGGLIPIVITCAGALISDYELFVGTGLNPTNWQNLIHLTTHQIISDTVMNWKIPDQADTIYTFRLLGFLKNGRTLEDYVSIQVDFTPPVVSDFSQLPLIASGKNGILFSFNSDDISDVTMKIRVAEDDNFQAKKLEFQNRRHADLLFSATNEFYFEIANLAKLKTIYPESPTLLDCSIDQNQIFDFLQKTNTNLNPGYFLSFTTDFDNDGNSEILMNVYDGEKNFGNLSYWEFEKDHFVMVKNTDRRLIPRDVADINGDGNLDVLTGAGKASLILAAFGDDPFPNSIVWLDTNDVWASRFYDFNHDGFPELIAKAGNDWKIWQNNRDYSLSILFDLPNNTEGENGTGIPHVEIGDFDGDNKTEILFGDYDGDIVMYEISPTMQPTFEWSHRLPLIDAIDFLASGDYDGDGLLEFAAGCHSSDAIDLEHQFDERHWSFRIYDFVSGSYQSVWEQRFHPYFPPKDFDCGVSSSDVDNDGNDELIISIYPNLYLISFDASSNLYQVSGHFQKVRSNKVVVSDFDVDGTKEILLNTGEKCRLFKFDETSPNIPNNPASFQAIALDSARIRLTWTNFISPDSFRIYRGTEKEQLDLLTNNWTEKFFIDSSVVINQEYWYQISRFQKGLREVFSKKVSVTPHRPARVVSSKLIPPNQLLLSFSLPMSKTVQKRDFFLLQSVGLYPTTLNQSSNLKDLLLSWENDFIFSEHDTLLLANLVDSSGTPFDQRDVKVGIQNSTIPAAPYITQANFVEPNKLQIEFSEAMEIYSLVDVNNYCFEPEAAIVEVKSIHPSNKIIELKIKPKIPIGPIGTGYDLYVRNVISQRGIPIDQEIGYRVTFIFVAKNLSNVYVYPNPARDNVTFARLTQETEIEIYNVSGILIKKLEAKTINGGFKWNLFDENSFPVPSGIYIFRVFNEHESQWGKFAVVR